MKEVKYTSIFAILLTVVGMIFIKINNLQIQVIGYLFFSIGAFACMVVGIMLLIEIFKRLRDIH
jgi:bacteriorhodopsin